MVKPKQCLVGAIEAIVLGKHVSRHVIFARWSTFSAQRQLRGQKEERLGEEMLDLTVAASERRRLSYVLSFTVVLLIAGFVWTHVGTARDYCKDPNFSWGGYGGGYGGGGSGYGGGGSGYGGGGSGYGGGGSGYGGGGSGYGGGYGGDSFQYVNCERAIIDNGTVQLGVWSLGHLNVPSNQPSAQTRTPTIGLRLLQTGSDATSPGCHCEGWGAGDATSGISGWANQASGGGKNLSPVSFFSTDTTAISTVNISGRLEVTHDYHPSAATSNLYETTVTIKNIGTEQVAPRYRRVMDWDIEPTAFSEYVTINGGSSQFLAFSSDDGFASSNPFAPRSQIRFSGNAVDDGPDDHGALFDFEFPELAPGESQVFRTYYGAAVTETAALDAVESVGAEVYSLGQPNVSGGPDLGQPNTFIFAFSGVGGTAIPNRLSLSPPSAVKKVGDTHLVRATVRDESGTPVSGKFIRYEVDGANASSGAGISDSLGRFSFELTAVNGGMDTVTAYADLDNDLSRDEDEPQANATVEWKEVSPVGAPSVTAPTAPGGGSVSIGKFTNPITDLTYLTVPVGVAASFPSGCMPLTIKVPINSGTGSVSNVALVLKRPGGSSSRHDMTQDSGQPGVWHGLIDCAASGDLFIEYDLTEGGVSKRFVVPIGGLTLIDPQGVVYDEDEAADAVAQGQSAEEARSTAAIEGALVTLKRKEAGSFETVLSGDPGISPNVNPETTGTDGLYAWDVSEGEYQVVVTKPGYETKTSEVVEIPPPVLDLHIPLKKIKPLVGFDFSPSSPVVGQSVLFSSTSFINGGAINELSWDLDGNGTFGDASGATASFTYVTPGARNVSLRATDDDGDVVVKTRAVNVAGIVLPPPFPPATPESSDPCAKKSGKALKVCKKEITLLKKCESLKGKKRATCAKRAKALAKCEAKSGKKRSKCVSKARAIGKKK